MLETKDIETALQKTKEALIQIHPLHAGSIRIWCILVKGFFQKKMEAEAMSCFENAISALNFHWGEVHPLHSNLYSFLAEISLQKENYKEAGLLYKNSLLCCFKHLGPNHIHTGQIYLDLSKYYCLIDLFDDALIAIEKAYNIYISYYGKDSLLTVSCGVLYGELLFKMGRHEQSIVLIQNACIIFNENIKGFDINLVKNEKNDIVNKFYAAAIIGMKIGIKTGNFKVILEYSDKIWMISRYLGNINTSILLKSLKYSLDATLNNIPKNKKNLVLKHIFMNQIVNKNEIELILQSFQSERFVNNVFNNGGIVTYLEKLINEIIKIQNKDDSRNQNVDLVCELRAILEISTDN